MGLGGGGIIAEAAGIGYHAGVQALGRQGSQRQTAFHSKSGDQTAAAFKRGVRYLDICDLLHENVVIHAQGFLSKGIAVVADELLGGGIQDDGQSAVVCLVSHLVHFGIVHKAVVPGTVAHGQHLFVGKIVQNNVLQADLAAQGITIGSVVPVDDDAVVVPDGLQNCFKHSFLSSQSK